MMTTFSSESSDIPYSLGITHAACPHYCAHTDALKKIFAARMIMIAETHIPACTRHLNKFLSLLSLVSAQHTRTGTFASLPPISTPFLDSYPTQQTTD
jgi:hypothetical protein